MKKTIITLASIATLATSANAQTVSGNINSFGATGDGFNILATSGLYTGSFATDFNAFGAYQDGGIVGNVFLDDTGNIGNIITGGASGDGFNITATAGLYAGLAAKDLNLVGAYSDNGVFGVVFIADDGNIGNIETGGNSGDGFNVTATSGLYSGLSAKDFTVLGAYRNDNISGVVFRDASGNIGNIDSTGASGNGFNVVGTSGIYNGVAAKDTQVYGAYAEGNSVGTVFSIPEPSSTALLGLGALALIVRRKR